MKTPDKIQDFPFLTNSEFGAACDDLLVRSRDKGWDNASLQLHEEVCHDRSLLGTIYSIITHVTHQWRMMGY